MLCCGDGRRHDGWGKQEGWRRGAGAVGQLVAVIPCLKLGQAAAQARIAGQQIDLDEPGP